MIVPGAGFMIWPVVLGPVCVPDWMNSTVTSTSLPVITIVGDAVWNGSEFLGVSNDFVTSSDGLSWSSRSVSFTGGVAVAWNGSIFCAINGAGDVCGVSSDGITWTMGTMDSPKDWRAIAWNGSIFCAIAYNTVISNVSSEGLNWTEGTTLPFGQLWVDVAWNGTVFCTIAESSDVAATSTDGLNWTQRTLPTTQNWAAIAWNGTVFCAVGRDLFGDGNVAATSPDGITWTQRTMPVASRWVDIYWNGSAFCAISANADIAAISLDGITWTTVTLPTTSANTWTTVVGNDDVFVVFNSYETTVAVISHGCL